MGAGILSIPCATTPNRLEWCSAYRKCSKVNVIHHHISFTQPHYEKTSVIHSVVQQFCLSVYTVPDIMPDPSHSSSTFSSLPGTLRGLKRIHRRWELALVSRLHRSLACVLSFQIHFGTRERNRDIWCITDDVDEFSPPQTYVPPQVSQC